MSKKSDPKVVPLEVVDEIPRAARETADADQEPIGSTRAAKEARRQKQHSIRFILTLIVAAIADGLEAMFPFAWIPIDLATVGFFFLLWGFRWEVAVVLIPELIPGVNMFPSWILLALYFGSQNHKSQTPPS